MGAWAVGMECWVLLGFSTDLTVISKFLFQDLLWINHLSYFFLLSFFFTPSSPAIFFLWFHWVPEYLTEVLYYQGYYQELLLYCLSIAESQNGRGWQGPLWSPSPTPCRSRVTQSRLHSTASSRGLNISREGDSTASLGSLGQGSVTLRGKKFFLMFRWNFLCFSLCPFPLVLSLDTTEESLAPSS